MKEGNEKNERREGEREGKKWWREGGKCQNKDCSTEV